MRVTKIALLALLTALPAGGGPDSAGTLKKIPLVQLEVRSMSAGPSTGPTALTLVGDQPASIRFATRFGDEDESSQVKLRGRLEPAGDDGAMLLLLQATLTLPDGRRIESSQEAVIRDRKTILFELYRENELPLTLAIVAQLEETWEVIRAPSIGAPVRLEIEIQRLESGRTISLERNMLNTFVGLEVQYEFRLGNRVEDDALTLNLTPVRLIEDLIEIKVSVFGKLPDELAVTMIARTENLVVSRGVATPVDVVVGDPPTGYRFLVTPRF